MKSVRIEFSNTDKYLHEKLDHWQNAIKNPMNNKIKVKLSDDKQIKIYVRKLTGDIITFIADTLGCRRVSY